MAGVDYGMAFVAIIILIVKLLILKKLCCRTPPPQQFINGPSVTVTTTTQHAQSPQVVPPYPIDTRHPVPASNITGYGNQAPYQQYPFHQTGNVASPMAGATPYPPQPYQQAAHDYSANPPPYDVAVSQPPLQPPPNSKEGYVKQSPYNPGYN
uniref:Protein shisa-5 n=1 Tax=Diabrotica virgifera virgifera TaxID=50390 RepID=A0A6P7GUX7_DIAVI